MVRVGGEFVDFMDNFKAQVEPHVGRKLKKTEITNFIPRFMQDEGLDAVLIRRVRARRGLK